MRKIKPIITISSAVILIAVFSLRSDIVIESVMYSLRLCYGSVIPSLFPFFILCEFLMSATAGAGSNHCTAAFATGLITGFPTGVRNVCKLYSDGNIDKKSACALLHCTANASPAYIVAFIGVCIIGSKTAGIILLYLKFYVLLPAPFFSDALREEEKANQK